MPPKQHVERLEALTSLRFFAAFYVLAYHAAAWATLKSSPEPWARALGTFCGHGFVAVDFFFALSGFILAYNYPPERMVDSARFYRARFARVYPMYFVGLLAALPFFAARTLKTHDLVHALLELLTATTLTQAFFPTLWSAINPPGWSLSVEAFFYLLFPWLSVHVARLVSTPSRALAGLVLSLAAALLPTLLAPASVEFSYLDETTLANTLRYSPLLALPQFVFGVVLGFAHSRGLVPARLPSIALPFALLYLGGALVTNVIPYMLLHNGALLPAFGTIILWPARPRASWLNQRWLQQLGLASYSLYVLHLTTWIVIKIVLERSGFDITRPWVFALTALSAVAASLIAHAYIEVPARERIMGR